MTFWKTTRWGCLGIRLAAALLAMGACVFSRSGMADEHASLEYKVKAGYVFNFAKFVEWPESSFTNASAPFVIGLVGTDSFDGMLEEAMKGRNINGRSIVIRRFGAQEDPAQCQILFVSRSEKSRFPSIREGLQGRAVLTVGENDRFGQLGGMINFTLVSGQVKLETNPEAALAVGLKISSKLLAVSRTVKTETPR